MKEATYDLPEEDLAILIEIWKKYHKLNIQRIKRFKEGDEEECTEMELLQLL